MKKIFKLVAIALLVSFSACQKDDEFEIVRPEVVEPALQFPKKEMRAVWMATVDRIDWPSNSNEAFQKQQFIEYLDLFKANNINALIMQIRPCADAFYNSPLEPWSRYISGELGKDPGYDVLQFLIDETHKRGIEFHAWFNPYRITSSASTFTPAKGSMPDVHPEWTMRYDNLLLFRPALPEVRKHFLDVIDDVLSKYDIDGVHIDDYFYPYPVPDVVLDDLADYEKYGKSYASIEDFRRGNVNTMIENIHNLLATKYPQVVFSVSPFSRYDYNRDVLYADIWHWCENNWMHCVMPQLYSSSTNNYSGFITYSTWWGENSLDVSVVVGHGLYKFSTGASEPPFATTKELITQMNTVRKNELIKGSAWYNASALKSNNLNVTNIIAENYYQEAVLVPYMGPKNVAAPNAVSRFRTENGMLTWDAGLEKSLRYAVYHVDDNLKATLVATTRDTKFKPTKNGNYIVTSVTKNNLESKPSYSISIQK